MWLDKRCSCRHCRPQMSILPPKLLQCCFSNNLWYSNLTAQYFTPFPSSVFGMQKWRRLGQFHHVNDINVYLGTQRGKGSPTPKKYAFFVLNNKRQGFPFVKDQKSSTWTDTKRKGLKLTLLVGSIYFVKKITCMMIWIRKMGALQLVIIIECRRIKF